MKVFVWIDFVPTAIGLAFGIFAVMSGKPVESFALHFILGISVQIVMLLYRVITGFVAFFTMFEGMPSQYKNINDIMARVLAGPGSRPQDPRSPR